MKAWLRKVGLGLKIAEKVAVLAGQSGLTIQGMNPAEIDAIAHSAASAIIAAKKNAPAAPGILLPPSPPAA